jgi:hypothetical protein
MNGRRGLLIAPVFNLVLGDRDQDVDNTDEKPCEGPQVSHAVAGLCFSLLAGSKGCLIPLVVR